MTTLTMLQIKNAIAKQKDELDSEMFNNLLQVLWDLVNEKVVVNLYSHVEYDADLEDEISEWHMDYHADYYTMVQSSSKDCWVFYPSLYQVIGKAFLRVVESEGTVPMGLPLWVEHEESLVIVDDETLSLLSLVLPEFTPESMVESVKVYTIQTKKEVYKPFEGLGELLRA